MAGASIYSHTPDGPELGWASSMWPVYLGEVSMWLKYEIPHKLIYLNA